MQIRTLDKHMVYYSYIGNWLIPGVYSCSLSIVQIVSDGWPFLQWLTFVSSIHLGSLGLTRGTLGFISLPLLPPPIPVLWLQFSATGSFFRSWYLLILLPQLYWGHSHCFNKLNCLIIFVPNDSVGVISSPLSLL